MFSCSFSTTLDCCKRSIWALFGCSKLCLEHVVANAKPTHYLHEVGLVDHLQTQHFGAMVTKYQAHVIDQELTLWNNLQVLELHFQQISHPDWWWSYRSWAETTENLWFLCCSHQRCILLLGLEAYGDVVVGQMHKQASKYSHVTSPSLIWSDSFYCFCGASI